MHVVVAGEEQGAGEGRRCCARTGVVNPARWGGQRQECWQDTDEQHPVGLSHSPPSAGPVPEVVLKNNNKEVEINHDSCCEISKRWLVTEMKVGWSPQGFSFPFRSLGGC